MSHATLILRLVFRLYTQTRILHECMHLQMAMYVGFGNFACRIHSELFVKFWGESEFSPKLTSRGALGVISRWREDAPLNHLPAKLREQYVIKM